MKLKPLKNHVIVEEIKAPEKNKGGIIIPNADKNPTMKGVVLGVGPGVYDSKGELVVPPFKEGQIVLFSKGSGQQVDYENRKLIFFRPEDLLAIIKD